MIGSASAASASSSFRRHCFVVMMEQWGYWVASANARLALVRFWLRTNKLRGRLVDSSSWLQKYFLFGLKRFTTRITFFFNAHQSIEPRNERKNLQTNERTNDSSPGHSNHYQACYSKGRKNSHYAGCDMRRSKTISRRQQTFGVHVCGLSPGVSLA